MSHNLSVDIELLEVIQKRNIRLALPYTVIFFGTFFIFNKMYQADFWTLIGPLCIILALAIRYFVNNPIRKEVMIKWYTLYSFLNGVGWGSLFWSVNDFYGTQSVELLFCGAFIITLISGGISTFSASLKIIYAYIFFLSVIPIYVLLTRTTGSMHFVLIIFLGSILYQMYHALVAHYYLRDSSLNMNNVKREKDSLQEVIDSIPGIVTMVNNEGRHILVNNFKDGFYKEKLIHKKLGEAFPGSTLSVTLLSFLESGKKEEMIELNLNDQGEDDWNMVNLKRIESPEPGIIAVILPSNELIKIKNDLRIQEARAMYSSKLASVGELSAGIAHEINNPLTVIEGSASLINVLINEDPLDREAILKSTDKIINTSQRIARITRGLRVLSKDAEEEPFSNVSFQSIIEPCLDITKAKVLSHNIKLTVVNQESDVAFFGNEIQLGQVMMNLVSNAIDAVASTEEPRWIEIHYRPSFDWLDIYVIDSGPGVNESISDRIMDPFFTTKESDQGTGLGLSISKRIIELHNGNLTFMRDAEHTTFRARFPRMTTWPSR